jgi:hypothetical protein
MAPFDFNSPTEVMEVTKLHFFHGDVALSAAASSPCPETIGYRSRF